MTPTGSIEFGARQTVVNCLKVKEGERFVMITDIKTEALAEMIIAEAKRAGGVVRKFILEDFGPRPLDGVNSLKLPNEIRDALCEAKVSVFAAQNVKGEFASLRKPLFKVLEDNLIRHGHMIALNEEILKTGMSVDYSKIQALTHKIYDIVSKSSEIHIKTPAGTAVTFKIDPKIKWYPCDGVPMPGKWTNLPDGEVFTCPADANGVIVVDGILGDFFQDKYGDIEKTPLKYLLKEGRCVSGSASCTNADLLRDFEKHTFDTDKNSMRVGELGIGTNIGLTKLIGTLTQDEKFPGAHIALGDPYPQFTGATWKSSAHNDGVMRGCTITVDGKTIMDGGRFKI